MNESNAQFRSVLRGYDTAQVDQHVRDLTRAAEAARREAGELSIQVSKLESAQRQLKSDVEGHAARTHALEEAQNKAAAPTYADLGQRIGSMLKLADEEGNELRTRAQADAETYHSLADQSARATRESADLYAKETHSAADAEAARVLEDARRRADSVLDDATRQATARREEAEAVYERARAKSAAAAADFETTLATRRDTSAQEFAVQVAAAEQQLAAIQQRSEQIRTDSERAHQEATSKTTHQLEQASAQAQTLVAEAKTKADRIRDDSERVLAAATQRRDSINAQLTNVRQMLATLSGGAMINPSELADAGPAVSDAAAPAGEQSDPKAAAVPQADAKAVQKGPGTAHPDHKPDTDKVGGQPSEKHADDKQALNNQTDEHRKAPQQGAGVKG
jgi:DivIVA domain-containing protein